MREKNHYHVDKMARLELLQDKMLKQLGFHQHQDPTEQDPQLQAWSRQQKQFLQSMSPSQRPLPQAWMRQQKQLLQSMSPYQRHQLQQQQQRQLREHLQRQGVYQQIPPSVRSFEAGVCARRLMMFLHHIQQRPSENCITYWRKFVAEFFSPRAKQRLCLSRYKSAGHMLGMLPQEMWQCSFCLTKSGEGFEANYDVLARLLEVKFASGIVDELLYLEDPREYRISNGLMVLVYKKTVQETVHEKFRVVREGPLRIIFSQDLKILSWEFCAQSHQEFLVRRLIAPQVNQLLQVAQKFHGSISESGSEGVSQQDLQTDSNMVLGAGKQLINFTELHSLNDLGYPKKYVRALQVYEVVKTMKKDLMDFTYDRNVGPIEGLKRLSEQTANGSAQAAAPLTSYQRMLIKLNATYNPNANTGKLEEFSGQSLKPYPQMQQQQRTMYGTPNTLQQTHSHHLLQPPHSHGLVDQERQRLYEMYENPPNVQQEQAFLGQSGGNSNVKRKQNASTARISRGGRVPRRNNSSKADSNNNPHLSEDATELPDDFSDDNFFNDSDK